MPERRALLVGIDGYRFYNKLGGCVNDVNALTPLIRENEDGSPNFHCRALTAKKSEEGATVDRGTIRSGVEQLLRSGADVALFYFAGHGASVANENDVVLVTQDGNRSDPGVALTEILGMARNSRVPEVIIILDCCFSGGGGGVPQLGGDVAVIRPGLTLLAASRGDQVAAETQERGTFSVYLGSGLEGGAADVLGHVSVASAYAFMSESFDSWEQRPTFKSNLDRLNPIRVCKPAVPVGELRKLPEIFALSDQDLPLDPSYEPTAEPRHAEHEATFAVLQRFRAAKLVVPVGAEHMYFAAMESKSCRLTPLGRHYWKMAKLRRL